MSLTNQYDEIMIGAEVFGADGDKLGRVAEVYPGYITVEKGFFFPTDYYIPRSIVQSVQNGEVFLTVSKDAALHSGWDQIPTDLETGSSTTGVMPGNAIIDTQPSGVAGTRADLTSEVTDRVLDQDAIRIPVMEEELTATVRPTEAGAVRIEKKVVTEDRVLDVPVTDEQIRVERRVVDRPATAADKDAFEQIVIEVPLREETVDVHKEARVAEEIVVSKEAVQHTERVSDKVRREEVFIDEEGRVDQVNP